MATTSELRAIVEELELVDIGDAASYLGEETEETEKALCEGVSLLFSQYKPLTDKEYSLH
jgi:hypothetical protein